MNELTEKQSRELAKQIVKDSKNVRVSFGRTNGQIVLHTFIPGNKWMGRTIKSAAEWDDHPANERHKRNKQFIETQATESLIESNG